MKQTIYKCFIRTNKGLKQIDVYAQSFINAISQLYDKCYQLDLEIFSIDGITKNITFSDYKIK